MWRVLVLCSYCFGNFGLIGVQFQRAFTHSLISLVKARDFWFAIQIIRFRVQWLDEGATAECSFSVTEKIWLKGLRSEGIKKNVFYKAFESLAVNMKVNQSSRNGQEQSNSSKVDSGWNGPYIV